MPPLLPLELIELVAEHLSLEPREKGLPGLIPLCLTNSALRLLCQKHIFHAVDIRLYVPIEGSTPSDETLELDCRARMLMRAVINNPSLGQFVHRLTHHVTCRPGDQYDCLDDLLRVFDMMPNISDLELGTRLEEPDARSGINLSVTGRWREGVGALLRRPNVTTVRINKIAAFPLEELPDEIKALWLSNSWLYFYPDSWRESMCRPRHIRTLSCDSLSLTNLAHYLSECVQSMQHSPMNFSFVEKLSIVHHGTRAVPAFIPLFQQAAHLRYLEISVARIIHPLSFPGQVDFSSPPLSHIHPDSLSTLSHLTVRSCVTFKAPYQWLICPYTNVADVALTRFAVLERLRFEIILQGFLNLEPERVKDVRWGRLSDILTTPGACPKLREIDILVRIRASDTKLRRNAAYGATTRSTEECAVDAERLSKVISEVAYPAAFRTLSELRPEIKLSFSTEISAGPEIVLMPNPVLD